MLLCCLFCGHCQQYDSNKEHDHHSYQVGYSIKFGDEIGASDPSQSVPNIIRGKRKPSTNDYQYPYQYVIRKQKKNRFNRMQYDQNHKNVFDFENLLQNNYPFYTKNVY